jgi:hypothetical protein
MAIFKETTLILPEGGMLIGRVCCGEVLRWLGGRRFDFYFKFTVVCIKK